MKKIFACILSLSLVLGASLACAEPHEMPIVKTSPQLDRMKQLVGDWRGTGQDMQEGEVEVHYRLSSGGTAVVETISPGTPHEMITVYFDEAGKLSMTHYCMLGNHPTMRLTKETSSELKFSSDNASPLKGEKHMDSLDIRFTGTNSMEQRWGLFEPGKAHQETIFTLRRNS